MKKILSTYGNELYRKSLEQLEQTAYYIGKVDGVYAYTREWLEQTNFYKKNRYILDKPRGNGFFMWKPFIILESLNNLNYGDIVIYSDAGLKVIDNLMVMKN
jgi:hypothetical protein